ncbi:MAG: histidinol dehydrogenase [Odoribacter sp.]|nr:histidinol dehydrogenase [Odoribacter sp.]
MKRPHYENEDLEKICRDVFGEIIKDGDEALRKYTWYFDRSRPENIEVSPQEWEECDKYVSIELQEAIKTAKANIEAFHAGQLKDYNAVFEGKGFRCWQERRPIEKVGLYIPGGSAPLFSTVLMLAVPAVLAGSSEIILCSPPNTAGKINPVILRTAKFCGVTRAFKIGGIQAIGAMTFGTESVPKVYKIFGPGNQFVTAAKQLASQYGVAIDMPAGPSEVMVIADKTAYPNFIASDLLSQAEHGADSQVILLTTDKELPEKVEAEVEKQMQELPRKEIVEKALKNSKIIVLKTIDECVDFANEYAAEHLIVCTENYTELVPRITNAGSVFLGNYSPESAGDYASGTNHTLPTNSYARSYSGVNMDAFTKKITFQEISREGLEELGTAIETMAENEQLFAHRNAVRVRLENK